MNIERCGSEAPQGGTGLSARLKSRRVAPYFVTIGSRLVFEPVAQGAKISLPPIFPRLARRFEFLTGQLSERFWKYVKKGLTNKSHDNFTAFRAAIDNRINEAFTLHAQEINTLLAPNFHIVEKSQFQAA